MDSSVPSWLANPLLVSDDLTRYATNEKNTIEEMINNLNEPIRRSMYELGYRSLFPIQKALFPILVQDALRLQRGLPRDICVSAPTGSGKTLAYALPIVHSLCHRTIPRLRALIVVPTHDLTRQVKQVFDSLCANTSLCVAVVTGRTSFSLEQQLLVGRRDQCVIKKKRSLVGLNIGATLSDADYGSKIDILICTPGRLLDHLNGTPGFTLNYLRYFIMDEADKLLNQSYQDWLPTILGMLNQPEKHGLERTLDHSFHHVQKLLFSATLTKNPGKLANLQLVHPLYIAIDSSTRALASNTVAEDISVKETFRFSLPAGLSEFYITCKTSDKPLALISLILSKDLHQVLCFTNSLEKTHRLYRLLQIFGKFSVAEYSSDLNLKTRQEILSSFASNKIRLLISSDGMARGMDLTNVNHVINYDLPLHTKTYVHRVGRTARAGRSGSAYTLIQKSKVKKLTSLRADISKTKPIEEIFIKGSEYAQLKSIYQNALQALQHRVALETMTNTRISDQKDLLAIVQSQIVLNCDSH